MADGENISLNGATVLIADDDPLVSDLYKKAVKRAGGNAVAAVDGEDTLRKLDEGPVDIILLDIKMPKMNGYEVFRKLKSNPKTKDIPIIVLTSLDSHPEYLEEAGGAKVDEYLTKADVLPDEVIRKIAAHLRKSE